MGRVIHIQDTLSQAVNKLRKGFSQAEDLGSAPLLKVIYREVATLPTAHSSRVIKYTIRALQLLPNVKMIKV